MKLNSLLRTTALTFLSFLLGTLVLATIPFSPLKDLFYLLWRVVTLFLGILGLTGVPMVLGLLWWLLIDELGATRALKIIMTLMLILIWLAVGKSILAELFASDSLHRTFYYYTFCVLFVSGSLILELWKRPKST